MIAAIWVPDFHLQAWLRLNSSKADSSLGLVDSDEVKSVTRLLSVNHVADRHGVRPGMTVVQARAIVDDIHIAYRCAQSESEGLSALRDVLWGRSPQVHVSSKEPGWAYVGTRGLKRLFGDLQEWVQAVLSDLSAVGLIGMIGVAPGWQQARVLALCGKGILRNASEVGVLHQVACSALEPSHELAKLFQRLGITTIGDFLKVEIGDVLEHMGDEAFAKHQIVRGQEPGGPLIFERYEAVFSDEIHLEQAVGDLNALFLVLQTALLGLFRRLAIRGFYCRSVHLFFSYDGAGSEERIIESGCPTRSARVMTELCRLDLERNPPSDSVGLIRIVAEPSKVDAVQLDLFKAEKNSLQETLALTLARLEGVLGKGHVGSPKFLESYREDVFEMVPFRPQTLKSTGLQIMPASLCLRRFRPPLKAIVLCRGSDLIHFSSEHFSGRIKRWHGPYRICAEWWNEYFGEEGKRERGFFADLYDVEVRDRVYRLCWSHRGRAWSALGWYD